MDDIDLLGYALLGDDEGLEGAFGDYAMDIAEGAASPAMVRANPMLARYAAAAAARRAPARAVGAARANALIRKYSPVAGIQQHGMRDQYLPFALFTFTATSGTALTQTVRPQKAFAGRRLLIDIVRNGATATALVGVSNLQVGAFPQSIGEAGGVAPAAAFAAGAFQTSLNIDRADPGVAIGLQISLNGTALTMTDTILVSAMLIGHTLS